MSLFKPNFKKELQELISTIESKDFQLPDNWAWRDKKDAALLAIEKEDVKIIKEIKKLCREGHSNRKLTSEILSLAIKLRNEIQAAMRKPDFEHQAQRAKIINSLINGLDAFLREQLTMEILGVKIHHLILYHGSASPDRKSFERADYATVGAGIYLTDKGSAERYAKHRANSRDFAQKEDRPVIYKFELKDAWLADLRNEHKIRICFEEYAKRLEELLKTEKLPFYVQGNCIESIKRIRNSSWKTKLYSNAVKLVTQTNGDYFSRFLTDHGYDGLITHEGGEEKGEFKIGSHVTYVIFDPSKPKLLREIKVDKK